MAAVSADRAAVAAARVSLSYNRIVAPAAGRAGAINVFAGSYVQPSSAPLVTITQLDPIAVSFTLPQRNLPDVLAALKAGSAPVQAALPDNPGTLTGRLQFVDNAVDASSGTVKVKAVFDNRDLRLWPGAYVNVELSVQTMKGVIVIPQAAIIQGSTAKTAFVVGRRRQGGAAQGRGARVGRQRRGGQRHRAGHEGHRRRQAEPAPRRPGARTRCRRARRGPGRRQAWPGASGVGAGARDVAASQAKASP